MIVKVTNKEAPRQAPVTSEAGSAQVAEAAPTQHLEAELVDLPFLAPMLAAGLEHAVSSEPVDREATPMSLQMKAVKAGVKARADNLKKNHRKTGVKSRTDQLTQKPKTKGPRRSPRVRVSRARARVITSAAQKVVKFIATGGGGQQAPLGEDGHPQVLTDVAEDLGFMAGPEILDPNQNPPAAGEPTVQQRIEQKKYRHEEGRVLLADFKIGPDDDEKRRKERWAPLRLRYATEDQGRGRAKAVLAPETNVVERQDLEARRQRDLAQLQASVRDKRRLRAMQQAVYQDVERYALVHGVDALKEPDGFTVLNWSILSIMPV